jgi:predicted transcriptional regulator
LLFTAQKLTQCIANAYITKYPKYNLLTNNCQHFVKALLKGIRDTGRGVNDEANEKAIDALSAEPEVRLEMAESVNGDLDKQGLPSMDMLATAWACEAYQYYAE